MTEEELFAIDTQIPERIWEITYQSPNGDWHWYRTDLMCFEDACIQAIEGRSSVLKLIRIERVPTIQRAEGGRVMNPKQKGVKAGYHNGQEGIPQGCPYELRTDMRRDWLEGWALGINLRNQHREELMAVLTTTGSETPDSVMKRFNERFK